MNLFIFIVPLAALAAIYYRLHNHLRAFFKQAQERCKKPGNEQFDTGESFDAYYNEIARRLGLGTILFIYTGHLFVWLCLVSFPWESHIPGEVIARYHCLHGLSYSCPVWEGHLGSAQVD